MMEQNRLSHSARTAILFAVVVMLAACEKSIIDEDLQSPNSLLQIRTRAGGGDEATVSYPVQVYVFQGEECKAVQTIGGASSTDYNLPTKEDATTTTALTLKDGKALTDLMAATATATLVDGGTNTVTLGLQRKVMLLQDITISQVPTAATAVSVTIAPLWENVTVGGTYAGTSGSTTIALTRQSDNGIGYHKLGGTSWATVPNTTTAYRLRPVAVVTVAKE